MSKTCSRLRAGTPTQACLNRHSGVQARLRISLWILCVPVLLSFSPLSAGAQSEDPIRVADNAVVTRGDFIRAAVRALDLDTEDVSEEPLPYQRVPNALLPYIRVAHENGALSIFGDDLLLAQGMSRGEALQVAVILGDLSQEGELQGSFKDVRAGSAVEKAVAIAMEKHWMEPLRENMFGVNRMLLGADANLLLRKMRGDQEPEQEGGDAETMQTPTIKVTFTRSTRPLPKSEILETLWQIVNEEYIYEDKINQDEAAYSAAEAIMKSLNDPYSTFMRPVQSRSFQSQIQGRLSGIGAQVEYKDGYLTIVSPLRGSPAEEAGLKPGDNVLSVDGFNIVDIGFLEAVEHVRGPDGSKAKLMIRRDGLEFEVEVTRALITVPEVEITWQGEVAIVKILQFGKITQEGLREQIENIDAKNPKGFILDLRGNPGGLLGAATSVMGNLVPKGSVVAGIRQRNSTREEKTETDPVLSASVPMIVLINGGSASASEIVAGALQDHKRATVVGEKSFGKGTVQQVLQFNDQSSFKLTIAEWYTPGGRKIDGIGIQPDIEVAEAERDEQMSRALELLRR